MTQRLPRLPAEAREVATRQLNYGASQIAACAASKAKASRGNSKRRGSPKARAAG